MLDTQRFYSEIEAACKRFDVKRLELFGSSVRDDFGEDSDVDVLVEFNDLHKPGISDRYFGLAETLAALFERHVDLVEISAVKNPYFRESINRNRVVVYGR